MNVVILVFSSIQIDENLPQAFLQKDERRRKEIFIVLSLTYQILP